MLRSVSDRQVEVLRWIDEGCPEREWPDETHKHSARALQNRGLARVGRRAGRWSATITDAGRYYLEHGSYPEGHGLTPKAEAPPADVAVEPSDVPEHHESNLESRPQRRRRSASRKSTTPAHEQFAIESPAQMRARGSGAAMDTPAHVWDERVLISVKEAAWVLSLSEALIRTAVRDGDLDRVFIGAGTTNYRIVYNSLLAWVNSMPQEPVRSRW